MIGQEISPGLRSSLLVGSNAGVGSCHSLEGKQESKPQGSSISESLSDLLMLQSPNASHKNLYKVWSFLSCEKSWVILRKHQEFLAVFAF